MRKSREPMSDRISPDGYNKQNAPYSRGRPEGPSSSLIRLSFWAIAGAVGIMVSAWFLAKAFVAFAPLASVYAQYNTTKTFPSLLDATADELTAGLAAGAFTSLDLVQVCFKQWLE